MLSYQHIYHAGNFADVHKHTTQIAILDLLTKNREPIFFCDTHAGRGYYDLTSEETQKIKEYKTGISRVRGLHEKHPLLKRYLELVGDKKDVYAGSAILAAKCLRPKDKGFCFELHPQEFYALRAATKPFRDRLIIRHEDGYYGLEAMEHDLDKGLVLFDPSYEQKNEYLGVVQKIEDVLYRYPHVTMMAWYPILPAGLHQTLQAKNALRYEFFVRQLSGERGMAGSGLLIINPPEGLQEQLESLAPVLRSVLAQDKTAYFDFKSL